MHVYRLERQQIVPRAKAEVFEFFADAANLQRITPPWLNFQILTPDPIRIESGALIDYRLRWGIVPLRWRTEIRLWSPPDEFSDFQLRGPYRLWDHHHRFETVPQGTRMTDVVRYALPLGPLGRLAHPFVRRDLERIFDYRAQVIREIFGQANPADSPPFGAVRSPA